jgi:hypothetical protein
MLEFILIGGLFWLSWRIRKAARKTQTSRLDVHVFVHYPNGGPGEREPEVPAATDNVIEFRRQAA